MNKTSTLIYHEWSKLFREMSAQDVKTILLALLEYDETGKEPSVDLESDIITAIYKMMLEKTKKNHLLYAEKCEKLAKNGALGGRPRKTEKAKKADRIGLDGKGMDRIGLDGSGVEDNAHTPPTFEELQSFCEAEGLRSINPKWFYQYYESIHWQIDGQMIDWKARARLWDSQDKEKKKPDDFNNFSQRDYDWGNLEKELLKK